MLNAFIIEAINYCLHNAVDVNPEPFIPFVFTLQELTGGAAKWWTVEWVLLLPTTSFRTQGRPTYYPSPFHRRFDSINIVQYTTELMRTTYCISSKNAWGLIPWAVTTSIYGLWRVQLKMLACRAKLLLQDQIDLHPIQMISIAKHGHLLASMLPDPEVCALIQ